MSDNNNEDTASILKQQNLIRKSTLIETIPPKIVFQQELLK